MNELRRVHLDVSDAPALRFSPILPGMKFEKRTAAVSPDGYFDTGSSEQSRRCRFLERSVNSPG